MAFTYTNTCPTDKDKLRLLISDTDSSHPIFDDNELTVMLEVYGNSLHYSAAGCCRALATNAARMAIAFSIHGGDISISKTQIAKHYMTLADMFETTDANINIVEYFDAVEDEISKFGEDFSEMVGDNELY